MRPGFVADTNVLISFFMSQSSISAKALIKALDKGDMVFSEETFQEFSTKINGEKFIKYLSSSFIRREIDVIRKNSLFIETKNDFKVCRDRDDNKFLNVAVEISAFVLITGDKDLLVLEKIKNIPIVTPGTFLRDFK